MVTIKKFNNISDAIYESLPLNEYKFITEGENYDAAIVRSADLKEMPFPAELCAIARAGAGVNNIPLNKCSEQGIVVFNTPGANANAVKELVICALLLSCRRIVPGIEWVESRKRASIRPWRRRRRTSSVRRSPARPWALSDWVPSALWWPMRPLRWA